MSSYPPTENFLRYAAARGAPAEYQQSFSSIVAGSALMLDLVPLDLRTGRKSLTLRVEAVRLGEVALAEDREEDKPFEGLVLRSSDEAMQPGNRVVGCAVESGQARVFNTDHADDLALMLRTFAMASAVS